MVDLRPRGPRGRFLAGYGTTATCYCGQVFRTQPATIRKGNGKFCSRVCCDRYRNTQSKSYRHILIGDRYRKAHVLIVERVLGKALPCTAPVHHVNGVRSDNRHRNLVVCQDAAYHKLLHVMQRVRAAGGDPFNDKICGTCRAVKPKTSFRRGGKSRAGVAILDGSCAECARTYEAQHPRKPRAKRKAA